MLTIKKITNKANKYTKKKGRKINSDSKILYNFYKLILKKHTTELKYSLFKINKNSIMCKLLEHIYIQFNSKQKIIDAINIEKSRKQETNKHIIKNKITTIVNKHFRESKYIDINIINFIITNVYNCKIVSYENIIKGKSYIFEFMIYNDKLCLKKLDLIVKKMLLVLQLIITLTKNESRNGQHVTFFLTPFKKMLNLNKNEILGVKNVNTGFTYPNLINGETFIYRKEEFFKVFIHESIHYYGIDKALQIELNNNINYNKFINLFNISNKDSKNIGINEALTEFWTFMIKVCVLSYEKSRKLENFLNEFERLYNIELIHLIFQIVKILNYNNLTYTQLLTKTKTLEQYRESSHIFSYYIVKTLLVYNHEDLFKSDIFHVKFTNNINICLKHHAININTLFINLIKYALNTEFIKLINKLNFYINSLAIRNTGLTYEHNLILNNLRMMSNDYII